MSSDLYAAPPVFSLRNVGVSFGKRRGIIGERFWALKNVNLDLYQGESLGVIGRNGAGKSTLLRVLAGILRPERGSIVRSEHHCALLSLRLGFIPYLTGRENSVLSGLLQGLKREEIERRMAAIVEFSDLGEFFERPINTYSSGMVARLAFSVAIQVDPDILLVDEILGVGDAEFKQKSKAVMQDTIRSHKTVVFVSHDEKMIQQLCDRVVWIEHGETIGEGQTRAMLDAYKQGREAHARAAS
jgi:lipopolysaccharide transport system ATP-binding protein